VAAAFPEAVSALVHDPAAEQVALVESLRSALSGERFQASVKAALGFRACRFVRMSARRSGRCRLTRPAGFALSSSACSTLTCSCGRSVRRSTLRVDDTWGGPAAAV
jgi:hypothetical protein